MALRKPKEKKPKADAPEKNAGAPNMGLMFAMMLAVFLVGAGMVVGYFKFIDTGEKGDAAKNGKSKAVVVNSMELEEMVVNLADPGNHYLKTKITIEYTKDKKVEELIAEKKHQVVEIVLLTLRKKTVAEVSPPEANEKLKGELIKSINSQLGVDAVQKVYFTQYIVN